MSSEQPNTKWWPSDKIADMTPGEFPITLAAKRVLREDPPKLGPDDDQLMWYEVEMSLVLGGKPIGKPVRFDAHKSVHPNIAFVAVMRAALEI
jgi:hypothetical protein